MNFPEKTKHFLEDKPFCGKWLTEIINPNDIWDLSVNEKSWDRYRDDLYSGLLRIGLENSQDCYLRIGLNDAGKLCARIAIVLRSYKMAMEIAINIAETDLDYGNDFGLSNSENIFHCWM